MTDRLSAGRTSGEAGDSGDTFDFFLERFARSSLDDDGMHVNSGIPNRAFVLVARALGGTRLTSRPSARKCLSTWLRKCH